jgi:putative flippase GtrA
MISNYFRILRFIFVGIIATLTHYLSLLFFVEIIELGSYGFSNLLAALFGITVSFIGSKYFTFKSEHGSLTFQIPFFLLINFGLLALHGFWLTLWSDILKLNFHYGFVIALFFQIFISYNFSKKIFLTVK